MRSAVTNAIDLQYGLDPVIEPGDEPGRDALERFVDLACPYCAEIITVHADLSCGDHSYIEDCHVCCQPITLSVKLTEQGQFGELVAVRGDG